jgi:PKD repeat protein
MGFDKKGRAAIGIIALLLIAALLSVAFSMAADHTIGLSLGYGNSPGIDTDNNGIESAASAIDFQANAQFSWTANESNFCMLWRVLPDGANTATLVCYGASHCCNFADLTSSAGEWNETFYLFPGAYNVASRAEVSAKALYVDYQISPDNLYSDIQFSEWSTLSAEFTEEFKALSEQELMTLAATGITVVSPDNSTRLTTGEIAFAVHVDGNASLLYSLDNSTNITAAGNTTNAQSNYTGVLTGSLAGGVLANGNHTLLFYADSLQLEHPFVVDDTFAPEITISLANNSIINTSLNITILSNELSDINYSLNSGAVQAVFTSRAANFTVMPLAGQNNMTITAADMQGNTHQYYYNFSYALQQGSCQDTVQNYHDGMNETGIDCGGACSDCVAFNVSLDKQEYLPGDLVFINVQARADALHNITITGPGYRTSFIYNGSTYYVVSPPNLGNYTVNVSLKYRNLTPEYIIKKFSLISNEVLAATINANVSAINKNETIAFSAVISGNKSLVSIKWDFNNDSTTDSTAQNANYTYLKEGNFLVKLNVSDVSTSRLATASITVRPYYNVTINATDKNYGPISSAIIRLNGETRGITPLAIFSLPAKSYDLEINASGYINRTASISISENSSFEYILYRDDYKAPFVALVGPDDNSTFKSEVNLVFNVQDETATNCTLVLYNGSAWLRKSSIKAGNGEHNFTLALEPSSYIWKVECVDESQNINTTELRVFTISAGSISDTSAESANEKVDQVILKINDAIRAIDAYGKLEQEAAETLKLKESLEKAKLELQRAVRDISNAKWRRFNTTDEQAYIEEALDRISAIEANITTSISVVKSAKFVSYPDSKAIEDAAKAYLTSTLKQPTKAELERYIIDCGKLQSGAVVTTDYKVIKIETLSGLVKSITLIEKSIEYNSNNSDILLVEDIPKAIVDSASKITALFDYEVIKEDPVLSVKLPSGNKYAYYVEGELTQTQAQSLQSVLLAKTLRTVSNAPTGFAIFSAQSLKSPKVRFIIEVAVALILLAVYITYSRGLFKFNVQGKERKSFNSMAAQVRASLQANNYDQSKSFYNDLQKLFKQLKPEDKKAVYNEVADLYHELDAKYVLKRIGEANILIAHGQKPAALPVYAELTRVYKMLPPQYKKEIYSSCMELHSKLGEQK